jgi:urease accessory protein
MARRIFTLGLLVSLSLPATVMAHPGHETHSFITGALHPLSGVDHLLAMLAVGLLAGRSGGSMRWVLPASFVSAMVVGAVLGMSGVHLPLIEIGISLSLIAFGSALVLKQPLSAPMLIGLTVGFALFHGHAHGAEMGMSLSAVPYALGFTLATALLHTLGVLLMTRSMGSSPRPALLKWSGSAIAAVGVASLGMLLIAPV